MADLPALTPGEIRQYSRHLILPEVGMEGQRRLKAARVLVVGAGGLGSPLGLYLAAAGVGTLGLVDFDVVDESNLHRQVLYGHAAVGRPKIQVALERLADVNPHIRLVPHELRLVAGNALELLADYDLVVDGTDNFATRYLVNDACVLLGKPNVYGSIFRFEGQVSVFWGARGPCYRCLFPEPPPPGLVPSCAEGGVLGVLPGIIGSLQANEVIKLIVGAGDPLIGRLVLFDALKMRFRELQLKKDPACPICAENPAQRGLIDYEQLCGSPPGAETRAMDEMTVRELQGRLEAGEPLVLLDVRTHQEYEIARLPGAVLIPLHELQERTGELDPAATIAAYCHHGGRSANAVAYLRSLGFERAINVTGGIDAWSLQVDPSVPRY
ncbi:MAG TPA: molybdenum cofactor biosynthesis protein MoeB [Acidobacteria bacterium]|nr:molybdenum cofactor biosynthesis protein MoeB [Acidobacteriota bacterium]